MNSSLEKLKKDIWRTSGARYNAARRLRRREFFATVSFALMSSFTVAIAFAQKIYAKPQTPADDYLTFVSALLGIFLLTLSLVEWGAKTGSKSDALHENAEKLNTLWRKIDIRITAITAQEPLTRSELESFLASYDDLRADCPHNHEPLDDSFFCSHHANEFQANNKAVWVRWQFSSIWYITLLWLLLCVLAIPLFNKQWWTLSAGNAAHVSNNKITGQ